METNLEVLNKISQKLGGSADATSVTESLNNIANALGDTNPDVIKSVSDSLNDILEYAGGGGGSIEYVMEETELNLSSDPIQVSINESNIEANTFYILKFAEISVNPYISYVSTKYDSEFMYTLYDGDVSIEIAKSGGDWILTYYGDEQSAKISIAKAPF